MARGFVLSGLLCFMARSAWRLFPRDGSCPRKKNLTTTDPDIRGVNAKVSTPVAESYAPATPSYGAATKGEAKRRRGHSEDAPSKALGDIPAPDRPIPFSGFLRHAEANYARCGRTRARCRSDKTQDLVARSNSRAPELSPTPRSACRAVVQ